jgi:magnesium transporter
MATSRHRNQTHTSTGKPKKHHQGKKSKTQNSSLSKKAGLPPGTPIYTGQVHDNLTAVYYLSYSSVGFAEWAESVKTDATHQDLQRLQNRLAVDWKSEPQSSSQVHWLHIAGMHHMDLLTLIAQLFQIHPLVFEDILHVNQPPKGELTPNGYFMVTGLWSFSGERSLENQEHPCQVSIVLIGNWIISFAESVVPEIQQLQERIRTGRGIIRQQSAAYGMYAIIDTILDSYYHVCDQIELDLDDIESLLESSDFSQQRIQQFRTRLGKIRRYLLPFREAIQTMSRELGVTHPEIQPYLRDLQDHSYHILSLFENYRDTITSFHDLYLSLLSQKMNNIMKVLTIISTIFLPLTFLAGVYGMNFAYMPELDRPWAYPVVLGIMAGIAVGMLWYFKKKKWL